MLFYERLYKLHIILGSEDAPALWQPEGWQLIQEDLVRVTKAARGPASLNSLQYAPDGQRMSDVKFGKLGLTAKSDYKWLHDYTLYPERKDWLFHSLELWAPGRTTCGKQGVAPDVFLGILNENYYTSKPFKDFNTLIVLAGATDKGEEFTTVVDEFAAVVAQQVKSVLHIQKISPWGRSSLSSFTDAIGDLSTVGLFKPGLKGADVPLIERIQDYWK